VQLRMKITEACVKMAGDGGGLSDREANDVVLIGHSLARSATTLFPVTDLKHSSL
jgi:hypothetical protein